MIVKLEGANRVVPFQITLTTTPQLIGGPSGSSSARRILNITNTSGASVWVGTAPTMTASANSFEIQNGATIGLSAAVDIYGMVASSTGLISGWDELNS